MNLRQIREYDPQAAGVSHELCDLGFDQNREYILEFILELDMLILLLVKKKKDAFNIRLTAYPM